MNTRKAALTLIGFVALCGVAASVVYTLRQAEQTAQPESSTEVFPGQGARPRALEGSHELPAAREDARPPESTIDADWNTYHGDSALRGIADCMLPDQLALLWRFKAGAPVRETPVVHQGRIFFATARGEVLAVDFSGQRVWSQELFTGEEQKGAPVRERIEAPVACFDDMIFVGTTRGVLYALDATSGNEIWRAQIDGPIMGTPNFLRTGPGAQSSFVYVIGRARGVLHCLDASSGRILWRGDDIERCDGSPSVSPQAIVFGSCAAALHVFSPDTGKRLRNIEIDADSQVAGGVALDGDLAVSGCRSGKILQADVKSGKILWTNADSEAETFETPAVTREWVVASSNDGNVMALERDTGKLRWRFDTKGTPTSPVIAGDKVIVAADGELFLLRLADGTKLWSFKISDEITSPAVASEMVLVGSEDGTVVAFGTGPKHAE